MTQFFKARHTNNILIILVMLVILVILVIIYNKQTTFTNNNMLFHKSIPKTYNNNNNNYIENYKNISSITIPETTNAQIDTLDTLDNKDTKRYKNYDYFDCYLKLLDINPKLVKEYMKYDKQHISNGNCKNATLHITVEPCPTDINGTSLSAQCNANAILTSSKGNPQMFTKSISPKNVSDFFGISI